MQSRRLFGTNGIRGVVNRDLTPEFMAKTGGAIGTFFRGGRLIVGHDGRTSSPMFAQVLTGSLASTAAQSTTLEWLPLPLFNTRLNNTR